MVTTARIPVPEHRRRPRAVIMALAVTLTLVVCLTGAAEPVRPAPTRPEAAIAKPPAAAAVGARGGRKIGGVEYVTLGEVARQLELKLVWLESGRSLRLLARSIRVEMEARSREIVVNGLRVFLGDPVEAAAGQLHISRVDFERCLTPLLRPGRAVEPRPQPKVIVLDAGHGGHDPGKINGKLGINEKAFTLDVALRVKKLLEAEGLRVVLTREDDSSVSLPQRPAIANLARADAFVSIHFNALANDTKTAGVEVYTFAPRFQRSTNAWGFREKNDAEDYASPGNRFDHWNVVLAQALHRRLITDLKVADRGKKLMHLGVLRPLNCPGALVECGFLSSDAEARKIAVPAYRQKIAVALAGGIRDYAAALGGGPAVARATATSR